MAAPRETGALSFAPSGYQRSLSGLLRTWHGALAAMALRGFRGRGPVLAWSSGACARKRKVL